MNFIGNCVNSFDEFGDCIIPQLPFSNVTKSLTFIEETDLLAMAYSSVSYMKLYAEQSTNNKDYWMMRAEQFERVANKLNTEMRQNMEAN